MAADASRGRPPSAPAEPANNARSRRLAQPIAAGQKNARAPAAFATPKLPHALARRAHRAQAHIAQTSHEACVRQLRVVGLRMRVAKTPQGRFGEETTLRF